MSVSVRRDVDRAYVLYRAGRSLGQLSAELAVSLTTIYPARKRGDVVRAARHPLRRLDISTSEIIRLRNEEDLTPAAIAELP